MGLGSFLYYTFWYAFYWAVPYLLDLDIMGFLNGTSPFDKMPVFRSLDILPAVEPIDFWVLSNLQKTVLILLFVTPYVDLETLKLFRIHRLPGAKRFIGFSKATKTKASSKVAKHTTEKQRKYGKAAVRGSEHSDDATEEAINYGREKAYDKTKDRAVKNAEKKTRKSRRNNSNSRQNPNKSKRVMTDGGRPVDENQNQKDQSGDRGKDRNKSNNRRQSSGKGSRSGSPKGGQPVPGNSDTQKSKKNNSRGSSQNRRNKESNNPRRGQKNSASGSDRKTNSNNKGSKGNGSGNKRGRRRSSYGSSGSSGEGKEYKDIEAPKDNGGFFSNLFGGSGSSDNKDSGFRGQTHSGRSSDGPTRVTKKIDKSTHVNRGGGGGDGISIGKLLVGGPVAIITLIILLAIIPMGANALGMDVGDSGPLAYGSYVPELIDQNFAGVTTQLEGPLNTYSQARARVFCLLEGPACLRQWRLNNTQRPGSESVGQTYGLKVDNFRAGQGSQIDVAYRDADYTFPVSFSISNPRHGLKGIDAKNVSYRIRMVEGVDQLDNPACDTGWVAIHNAYDIGEGDELQPGENGGMSSDPVLDDIFPGTAASTNFLRIDQDFINEYGYGEGGDPLTIGSCGMLQPSLGDSLTPVIDVKYNYFSQATLYFQAMSRETLEGSSDVEITNKKSETADTPVKAAVNVNSPVIYTQRNEADERDSQPFNLRATLNTDKSDVSYQVKDLYLENSDSVKQVDGSGCDYATPTGGEIGPDQRMRLKIANIDGDQNVRVYEPGYDGPVSQNSPAAAMFPGSQDTADQKRRDSFYWFDTARTAPMTGCTMELSNPEEISETGETLTVEVKSNYTVAKQDSTSSIRLQNNVCTSLKCPLLVTVQKNTSYSYNFKTECRGLDSGSGCSIINSFSGPDDWGDAQTGSETFNQDTDRVIESGEIAVDLGQINGVSDFEGEGGAGVDSRNWRELDNNTDGSLEIGGLQEGYSLLQFEDVNGQMEVSLVEGCAEEDVLARWGEECAGLNSTSS